jgi:hypothetical protein
MLAFVIAAALAQEGESLQKHEFKGVSMKAPKSWSVTGEEEGGKEWATDDDRAQMAFASFPVDPVRPSRVCVKQLTEAVSQVPLPDGGVAVSSIPFTNTTVGGQPAARQITTDFIGDKEEDKVEANKVTTTTIVGCNGRTKWLLTFTNRTIGGAKAGALLKRVIDSITYSK